MRIVLRNPTLDRYTSMSFRTLDQLDIEADIIDKFEQMLQSGDTLFFADELEISIIVVRRTNKKGSGFLHRTIMSLNRWLDCKKSIVTIDNKKHTMCFARALSVTMGYVKYKRGELSGKQYDRIRKDRPDQSWAAYQLHADAKVSIDHECGHTEWRKFQERLNLKSPGVYGINVWSLPSPKKKCIFVGNPAGENQLHILHYNNQQPNSSNVGNKRIS